MKYFCCLIAISAVFTSCYNHSSGKEKMRNEAIVIAEKYIKGNTSASERKATGGFIAIGDSRKIYIIDTARIYTGLIDDDQLTDVIMTLDVFAKGYQNTSEQLILLSEKGKLRLASSLESDMKILRIDDHKVIAEVPEHSRNSPLFNCKACREVVTFVYEKGNLRKTE